MATKHPKPDDGKRVCPTCGHRIQWLAGKGLNRFVAHFNMATKKWCTDPNAQVRI